MRTGNRASKSVRAGILLDQLEQGPAPSSSTYSPSNAGIRMLSFSAPALRPDGAHGFREEQPVRSPLGGTQ